jgi:hypothetical protein
MRRRLDHGSADDGLRRLRRKRREFVGERGYRNHFLCGADQADRSGAGLDRRGLAFGDEK